MKLFFKVLPKTILESHIQSTTPTQLDEIDAIANTIDDNMGKEIKIPKDVLDSFKLKDSLNPDIWPNGKLNPEVRTKLLQVANTFIKDMNLPKETIIKDIIFTGSLANFNWSKFSDIDLHVVLDYNQFDADVKMVEEFFYAQKTLWNQEHEVKIFDYPIEVYAKNGFSDVEAASIYSILKDKWLVKPKRESFTPDTNLIKTKAMKIINLLKDIRHEYNDKQYKTVVDKVTKLKDKIKQMRKAGLERGGEYSLENLVFKVLRRTPFMDLLDSYKAKAYDTLMSVAENLTEANQYHKHGILLIKGSPLEDNTQRLYVTTTNNVMELKRAKKNDSEGQPAKMAILGNQIYKLTVQDGKLKAQGVAWPNEGSQLKSLGLARRDVVLNDKKTPLHWETLKFDNINQALNSISNQIFGIPNIKWN